MATDLKTLQATADSILQVGIAKGSSFQDTYLRDHGRYAQCIQTPSVIPADGAKLAVDPTVKPYYQAEDWADLGFQLPSTSEISTRIDVYDGPKGKDWCCVATFESGGVRYTKSTAANGVEAPTFDWFAVKIPDPLTGTVDQKLDAGGGAVDAVPADSIP
jgi:hypothetical protein